jgi:hypothetical protein
MTNVADLRFPPPVASMEAFIDPHRAWIEASIGCPIDEALRLEVDLPFGQLAAMEIPEGALLDHCCLEGGRSLKTIVSQWEAVPGSSPRITLAPSRVRGASLTK